MKAPEKIYLDPEEVEKAEFLNFNAIVPDHRVEKGDIEYTRTDAFIEKAVSYLEGTLFNEVCYGEIRPDIVQAYINDFKKAMEE